MTKLSANSHYGQPAQRKINARNKGWRLWAQGRSLLSSIRSEERTKLADINNAYNVLDNVK